MWDLRKTRGGQWGSGNENAQFPNRRPNLWKWTERLLLASGLALLALYGVIRIESFWGWRAALEKFAALESSTTTPSRDTEENAVAPLRGVPSPESDAPEIDFGLWDKSRVKAYQESLTEPSSDPVAVLKISKIHLVVPVLDGTDELTLNHAVGRIAGTAWPGERGNIGIAGHRDGFFRGLKDVSVGDEIELKTLKGTDIYIVDRIQVVKPDNVGVLRPRSAPSLTLVTCYPFYFFGSAPQRYIVTASLVKETTFDPSVRQGPMSRRQPVRHRFAGDGPFFFGMSIWELLSTLAKG